MSEQVQRCGTCKWWEYWRNDEGWCQFPIETVAPSCMTGETLPTGELAGTTCPCWAAVENGEVGA